MNSKNPEVDLYISDGCGRCPLGGTPDCKVHDWYEELKLLRRILLESDLTEELKWKVPVYTFESKNICLISAFKDSCTLSFFKGSLLKDANGILDKPGENSQAARLIRFTDVSEIITLEPVLKDNIQEAVDVERAGLKVEYKDVSEFPVPEELQNKLDEDPVFMNAFQSLTPGRQRGYLLYFSQAKQSKTRESRIEKYRQKILDGRGMQDW